MKHYSFFTKSQMINLLKPLAFIFGSAVFLGVSAFSIHQYETINHQSKTIQHQHDKITSLRANYLDNNYLQDELVEENNILKATIVELRDSISDLHAEIFNLQSIIQAQTQKIEQLNNRIDGLQAQYASLKKEIKTQYTYLLSF